MNQLSIIRLCPALSLLFLLIITQSCAPVFSELQDARTVGQGQLDGTVSFSNVGFADEGESQNVQNEVSVQAAYGFTDRLDIRVRFSSVFINDEDIRINVLGLGPKFSFIKDRLSAYLPAGFAFGEEDFLGIDKSDRIQIHPTVLGTFPIENVLDINPSIKVLIPFGDNMETLVALNLGLGIRLNKRITVRPEYGVLFNPGEDGHYRHFSIGLTFNTSSIASRE